MADFWLNYPLSSRTNWTHPSPDTAGEPLSLIPEPDTTDPLIFLSVPLVADPAEEEMFCLILKCEENCCEPAKSH